MNELLDSGQPSLYEVITAGPGPQGKLPLTDDLLRNQPSGHAFGMSQDVGMGWTASAVGGPQYVLLSTLGGVRADNGEPIALGYHTGHWELVLALKAAAEEIKKAGGIPYAGHCTDPCDGRTQGTSGMFDSPGLPQRRRLRAPPPGPLHPQGPGRAGRGHLRQRAAGHDDGPGRPPRHPRRAHPRRRHAAAQRGRRYGQDSIDRRALRPRRNHARRSGPEPVAGLRQSGGGGCHFLGTAATSQVVGEALGWRCRTPRSPPPGNRSGSTWPGGAPRP